MSRAPNELRALYTRSEWVRFEKAVLCWLGEGVSDPPAGDRVLTLDEALLTPSSYTYAVAAKAWMTRLGMSELAERIIPENYSDRWIT